MPIYTFKCVSCLREWDFYLAMDDRHTPQECTCGHAMRRVVEGFKTPPPFHPHFDEGLGVDVYSEDERKAIMKSMGVVEAGDAVHGARNFDKKAPEHVGKLPVTGKRYEKVEPRDFPVEVVDSDGYVVDRSMFSELEDSE